MSIPEPIKLPPVAVARLRQIGAMADDASVLATSTKNRVQKLQNALNQDQPVDAAEIASLREAQHAHQQRYANATQLLANLKRYIDHLPYTAKLESYVRTNRVRLLPEGKTPQNMVEQCREEIATLRTTIVGIERAPAPFADQREAVERWVDDMLKRGAPILRFIDGKLSVKFGESDNLDYANHPRIVAIGFWAMGNRDEIVSRLLDQLPPMPETSTMAGEEKRAKIAQLKERILQVERDEDALIEKMNADGIPFLRRPDADPCAVLGIVVGRQKAVAA